MSELLDMHHEAMELAFCGDKAEKEGDVEMAKNYFDKAFEKEREAAFLAESLGNPEPGLSILFRSAASLGVQCGRLRDTERLIAHILSGEPDDSVASDMRELLQQIYSLREVDDKSDSKEYRRLLEHTAKSEIVRTEDECSPVPAKSAAPDKAGKEPVGIGAHGRRNVARVNAVNRRILRS